MGPIKRNNAPRFQTTTVFEFAFLRSMGKSAGQLGTAGAGVNKWGGTHWARVSGPQECESAWLLGRGTKRQHALFLKS